MGHQKIYNMNINELMNKPLWQMTGEEFLAIINEKKSEEIAPVTSDSDRNTSKHYVYGLAGIARLFGCSIPTANRIKKSGVIDKAITQCGRKIIVDSELALQLAGRQPRC